MATTIMIPFAPFGSHLGAVEAIALFKMIDDMSLRWDLKNYCAFNQISVGDVRFQLE